VGDGARLGKVEEAADVAALVATEWFFFRGGISCE